MISHGSFKPRRPIEILAKSQEAKGNPKMEVATIDICLTKHDECSGKYIDFSERFIIRCHCYCHQENTSCESGDVGLEGQNRQPQSNTTRF